MSEKYALYDISFLNALLYCRAMPMPDDTSNKDDSDAPLYDDSKDANNPENFKDFDEEIEVKAR